MKKIIFGSIQILHWNWAKVSFKKYLKMKLKTLITIVILLTIFISILVLAYLIKDLSDTKDFKNSYPKLSLVEVLKKDYNEVTRIEENEKALKKRGGS